jgi:membrane-associated protein
VPPFPSAAALPTTPFLPEFLALVEAHGPWMLFLLAFAETCFITGIVVPSGVATSLATILAADGHLPLATVALAALAGGWAGDSVGFWVGRRGGEWLASGEGRVALLYRRRRRSADRIFRRHPVVSVSVARLISFVRTIMPMAAGMSSLSYRRFLPYQALGVTSWTALYMSLGYVAGESWELASRVLGAGGAAAFLALLWLLWRITFGRGGADDGEEPARDERSGEVQC